MLVLENGSADIGVLAESLPSFPRIVLAMLELLRQEEFPLDTLVRLARNDPVITAHILADANHLRRLRLQPDLLDPFAAASLIGTNRVRQIVASVGMNLFLSGGGDPYYFQHSLAVAIIAQELATLTGGSPEEAYIAGMLHDVGQLAFHVLDQQAFQAAARNAAYDGRLLEHERAAFGIDHCTLGGLLAEYWELPAEIVSAVRGHHDHDTVTSRLQASICIADSLARALDLPPSPNNRVSYLNSAAVDELGLQWGNQVMADCFGRCRPRCRKALRSSGH